MQTRCITLTGIATVVVCFVLGVAGMITIQLDGNNNLHSYEFITLTLPSKYQCMELCVAFSLCRSMQYDKNSGTCNLNSDSLDRQWPLASSYPSEHLARTAVPQEISAGSCGVNSCKSDEVCVNGGVNPTCVKHGQLTVKCPRKSAKMGNKCYKVFTVKKSWKEAWAFCSTDGSLLMEIHIWDEHKFHSQLLPLQFSRMVIRGEGYIWTGLEYSSSQTAWIWNGTGTTLTSTSFNRFTPSIPTPPTDMCMGIPYVNSSISLKNWTAVSCDEQNIFICQYESPDFWP